VKSGSTSLLFQTTPCRRTYSGIRPKIYGQGQLAADFMIQVQ